MVKVYFTFDCEDFINPLSVSSLRRVLELLQKYDLKAIFFLTGHMCDKLRSYPKILDSLEKHEIGYHSTSHSVHPNVYEYTDIEDYNTAYSVSLRREQSQINPLTGEDEGRGGLLLLKDSFPNKRIVAFRAPGFCWSPPHSEALESLGIRFDFSTSLSRTPIRFKKTTFYPYPTGGYRFTAMISWGSLMIFRYAVLMSHPRNLAKQYNDPDWDSIYYNGNPKRLLTVQSGWQETKDALRNFESFLKITSFLAEKGILQITPPLQEGVEKISFTKEDVLRSYQTSMKWAKSRFNYRPKFLLRHFFRYFNLESEPAQDVAKSEFEGRYS